MISSTPPVTPELLFDPIRRKQEQVCKARPSVGILGYSFVTLHSNDWAWGSGWNKPVFATFQPEHNEPFAANQLTILALSNELFSEAKPLGNFEQQVMNETFLQILNDKPIFGNW